MAGSAAVMLLLATEGTRLSIDVSRGADLLDLSFLEGAFTPLFSRQVPRDRSVGHDPVEDWMDSYRGGMQTLFPSAGARRSGEVVIDFHGQASVESWNVLGASRSAAELLFRSSLGPTLHRRIEVRRDQVQIDDLIANPTDRPHLVDLVYHLVFGGSLAYEDTEVFAHGHVADSPANAAFTHHADLGDIATFIRLLPDFGTLTTGATTSRVRLVPSDGPFSLELEWTSAHLPFAWIWRSRAFDGPLFGHRLLGIEPATRPADDEFRGGSLAVEPGACVSTQIVIHSLYNA